jgi:serine protease SohB
MFDSETVKHVTELLGAYGGLIWEAVKVISYLLLALFVIGMLRKSVAQFTGEKKKVGKPYGLTQVNRSVHYERKKSLTSRRRLGQRADTEEDGLDSDDSERSDAETALATTDATASEAGPCVCGPTTKDLAELRKKAYASRKPVVWININNDTMASQRVHFAKCVNEVIENRDKISRVVVAGSSPGGAAPLYGHMYHEMKRLRECSGLWIDFVSDWCAASGGYMQAVAAHSIGAPKPAIIGSIGVIGTIINYREPLEAFGIKIFEETAGPLKRDLTQLGEVNDDKIKHFREGLRKTHAQFIAMVKEYRPNIDEAKCCTGEHWSAEEAKELGLIDRFISEQEALYEANQKNDVIFLVEKANPFSKGLLHVLRKGIDLAIERVRSPSIRVD